MEGVPYLKKSHEADPSICVDKNEEREGVSAESMKSEELRVVFDKSPLLQSIGTFEQYKDYLDNVFPDSKINTVVYHRGRPNISAFKTRSSRKITLMGKEVEIVLNGIYFGDKDNPDVQSPRFSDSTVVYPAIINVTNPNIIQKKHTAGVSDTKLMKYKELGYDGLVSRCKEGEKEYVVFSNDQILVLGSQKDKDAFASFVSQKHTIREKKT